MYQSLANHSLACDTTTNVTNPWIFRRIAEVKEKERRKALEEIIYSMIVQKFLDNVISMIPWILPTSDPTGRVGFRPNQEQKLEMIQSHLSIVLGERLVCPLETIVEISKVKL